MLKKYLVKVKVKNCELVFKKGLDKGVLCEIELEYHLDEKEYKKPLFIKSLYDQAEEIRKEVIEYEFKEIK
jgi:hypothetical protein